MLPLTLKFSEKRWVADNFMQMSMGSQFRGEKRRGTFGNKRRAFRMVAFKAQDAATAMLFSKNNWVAFTFERSGTA